MALSNAERQQRYRDRRKSGEKLIRYRRSKDRRTRPQQWSDAVDTLLSILDDYQAWRDSMPAGLEISATTERIDAILELRDQVEQLQGVELPRGFGRD